MSGIGKWAKIFIDRMHLLEGGGGAILRIGEQSSEKICLICLRRSGPSCATCDGQSNLEIGPRVEIDVVVRWSVTIHIYIRITIAMAFELPRVVIKLRCSVSRTMTPDDLPDEGS